MTCGIGDKLGASEGEVDELKRILIFCKSPHSVAEMMELLGRGSRDKFLMTILKPALNKGFISERLKSSADGEHLEYCFKERNLPTLIFLHFKIAEPRAITETVLKIVL